MKGSRLCRWCHLRPATTMLDGCVSCAKCAGPVLQPGEQPLAARVYRAVYFNPGAGPLDIIEWFNGGHSAVYAALRRLVKVGAIEASGSANERGYYVRDPLMVPLPPLRTDRYERGMQRGPYESKRADGCRLCPNGLLPEWGDLCPECRESKEAA